MKHILTLAFSIASFAAAAQGSPNSFSSTLGVFASDKVHGDWFSAEIRELDGTLSGCFASTSPKQGKLSFEGADLNLLSFREEGGLKMKIGINDFAAPGVSESGGFGKIVTDAENENGKMIGHVKIFLVARPDANGRYTILEDVSESGVESLTQGEVAAAAVSSERDPIYYSLRGSTAAISAWKKCSDNL